MTAGDLDAMIIAERPADSSLIKFTAYHIEDRAPWGSPIFLRRDRDSRGEKTEDPREAEPLLIGEIDGDGCTRVRLGTSGEVHFCSVEDVTRFGRLLERAVGVARELVDDEAGRAVH